MISIEKHALIITLVFEFWISGLFVLSVIFTQNNQLEDLTLMTFIAYAIGSFVAGILSDTYGRKPIFLTSTVLLTIAATVILFYPFYGYILANLAIGPLNNLTFVFINEVHPEKSQKYTVLALIGWAFSEITLGSFFLISNTEVFMYGLLGVTIIFMILAFLYVKQTQEFQKIQQVQKIKIQVQQLSKTQLSRKQRPLISKKLSLIFTQKLFPKTIKPLIGGSILMFMMQMFYYRTQFTLDTFGVSLQINTIVVGCTEVFANILFTKLLQSIKRKLMLRILIISLMSLLIFLIFSSQLWVQTIVEGFMRLVDTAILIVLGIYIPELFPSNEKGKGTNFIMSFGVIGSALNGKLFSHLPFWSLELFLLAALGTTGLLRETNLKPQIQQSAAIKQSMQDSLIRSQNNSDDKMETS